MKKILLFCSILFNFCVFSAPYIVKEAHEVRTDNYNSYVTKYFNLLLDNNVWHTVKYKRSPDPTSFKDKIFHWFGSKDKDVEAGDIIIFPDDWESTCEAEIVGNKPSRMVTVSEAFEKEKFEKLGETFTITDVQTKITGYQATFEYRIVHFDDFYFPKLFPRIRNAYFSTGTTYKFIDIYIKDGRYYYRFQKSNSSHISDFIAVENDDFDVSYFFL